MLVDLHDRNETLYHRIILDEVEEIAPLVYTPTVGKLCQDFSHNFTRPRGLYFTPEDAGDFSVLMQACDLPRSRRTSPRPHSWLARPGP